MELEWRTAIVYYKTIPGKTGPVDSLAARLAGPALIRLNPYKVCRKGETKMSEKEELNQILRDHPEIVPAALILLTELWREHEDRVACEQICL